MKLRCMLWTEDYLNLFTSTNSLRNTGVVSLSLHMTIWLWYGMHDDITMMIGFRPNTWLWNPALHMFGEACLDHFSPLTTRVQCLRIFPQVWATGERVRGSQWCPFAALAEKTTDQVHGTFPNSHAHVVWRQKSMRVQLDLRAHNKYRQHENTAV